MTGQMVEWKQDAQLFSVPIGGDCKSQRKWLWRKHSISSINPMPI